MRIRSSMTIVWHRYKRMHLCVRGQLRSQVTRSFLLWTPDSNRGRCDVTRSRTIRYVTTLEDQSSSIHDGVEVKRTCRRIGRRKNSKLTIHAQYNVVYFPPTNSMMVLNYR